MSFHNAIHILKLMTGHSKLLSFKNVKAAFSPRLLNFNKLLSLREVTLNKNLVYTDLGKTGVTSYLPCVPRYLVARKVALVKELFREGCENGHKFSFEKDPKNPKIKAYQVTERRSQQTFRNLITSNVRFPKKMNHQV